MIFKFGICLKVSRLSTRCENRNPWGVFQCSREDFRLETGSKWQIKSYNFFWRKPKEKPQKCPEVNWDVSLSIGRTKIMAWIGGFLHYLVTTCLWEAFFPIFTGFCGVLTHLSHRYRGHNCRSDYFTLHQHLVYLVVQSPKRSIFLCISGSPIFLVWCS